MRQFLAGVIVTLLVIVLGGYLILRRGYINFNADESPSSFEKKIAMQASDASTDRHAPDVKNPLPQTDETLLAGARIYRDHCAGCHGDPVHPDLVLGHSFNPPAPQFMSDMADMPDNQNFYIIQHGIRWTGMPAWKNTLNDTQTWQVVTFLANTEKLPAAVVEEFKKP
jgi:mono/diheme cytochrome c family protein